MDAPMEDKIVNIPKVGYSSNNKQMMLRNHEANMLVKLLI